MTWWATLTVSLSSAMVAGGITALAALTIARRQERATLAREVRAGIGNYFGALTVAVAHLQRMPEKAPSFDLLEELAKHAPKNVQDWFAAQRWVSTEAKMRRVLGPEPFAIAERVVIAHAPLYLMPLPTPLRRALDESLDYVAELGNDRSQAVKDRWPEIRSELIQVTQRYVVDADELVQALRTRPGSSPLPTSGRVETERTAGFSG